MANVEGNNNPEQAEQNRTAEEQKQFEENANAPRDAMAEKAAEDGQEVGQKESGSGGATTDGAGSTGGGDNNTGNTTGGDNNTGTDSDGV